MTVAIDTSVFIYFLNEAASAPHGVTRCKARVDLLIETLSKSSEKLIVPTPVLSEVLVRAGLSAQSYLQIVEKERAIRLADFTALAAVEAAAIFNDALTTGHLSSDERVRMKFDTMIFAIARVSNAAVIYSDDTGIKALGKRYGMDVLGIADLPAPPATLFDD